MPAKSLARGFYILADGFLTMTDRKAGPVRCLNTGDKILHKVRPDDDAAAVARWLTMEIYRSLRDETAQTARGFLTGAQLSGVGSGLRYSLRCAATTIGCRAVLAPAGFGSGNRRAFSRL
jgi:hypothetical protein